MVVWEPVKGAAGYEIWQRTGGHWYRRARLRGKYHVYYVKRSSVPGSRYVYRVRAYGKKGTRRSSFSRTVKVRIRLATPVIRSLTSSRIRWYRVRGATRYRVYMKKKKGSKWKAIGTAYGSSFRIPKKYRSKTAYYTVRAFRGKMKSGIDSGVTRQWKKSKYHSKKILFEGDSITYPYYSWARRTARVLGMKYTNRARNAARITNSVSSRIKNIYKRSMRRGFKGYSVIVFAAGTNDWGNSIRLGKKADKKSRSFYGAYRRILKKARKDAPKAKIILCLPMDRGRKSQYRSDIMATDYKNKQGRTLEVYRKAVRRLAKEFNCYVYDMAKAGIHLHDRKSAIHDSFDLLHPNYRTHIRISEDFRQFLMEEVLK